MTFTVTMENVLVTDVLPKYHRQLAQWGDGTGTHARLLDLVGFDKRVLEIGCSTGYLSRIMQQRGCQVVGLELDQKAAELARPFCLRVLVGDVEKLDWEAALGQERFDVITFGDVLEHLRAPQATLRQARRYLAPGGYIVVSLPNIAHGSIRLSLLLGRFEYTSLGILDETHLRFYTQETAQQLLTSCGFSVSEVLTVTEPTPPDLIARALEQHPQLDPEWMHEMLSSADARAFQYVFRAVPLEHPSPLHAEAPSDASVELSVVVSHQGDDDKLSTCLRALAADQVPLKIVVLSASEPVLKAGLPAVEWQARPTDARDVQVLNQAIAAARGDLVLLLDSGLVPQAGALAALLRRFAADAKVGVVGGAILAADQSVILQAGLYLSPLVAQLIHRGAGHPPGDAQWQAVAQADAVSASLMAFRRPLWQKLAGLDDGYCTHYFDADFCARARAAGYGVLVEPQAQATALFPIEADESVEHHRDRLRFVRQHWAWSQDFFEAEMAVLESALEKRDLRLAYLWQLTQEDDHVASKTFLSLYQRAKDMETTRPPLALPWLQSHRFSSTMPLIGGLIARFRALWGSVAARWYAEALASQQNTSNQTVCQRIGELEDEIARLEELVAQLGQKL